MPYRMNYPATVSECIQEDKKYKPAALRAVREFKRSHPFQGTYEERVEKFRKLIDDLSDAYGVARIHLSFPRRESSGQGNGAYMPHAHSITFYGHLSVVTALHEFGHARGFDERQACIFSLNLFKRFFPRSFSRCRRVGHMLVRES